MIINHSNDKKLSIDKEQSTIKKEIDEKKIRSQLQILQSITNDLTDTLNYLQSDERKCSIDNERSVQDQELINDISKAINSMMTKVGTSLNLTSINDVKPYIAMINNVLNNSN
ncbi:hypothetical protein LY90DRAFT_700383 [Neocallimastix californiae]|jgi:hypothetical protein|uniref:Uncharacterized protein n=1 Tax=Neocallimastix californiae TaxID=1754190 RepID=A0A1Y2EB91_9FUNG|nr:hypothetical protein LY90DRAFT_700383 [Neocallimastix californiae]|eukprot:ORY68105.1 hypothetical protein LY90DRAFT_700383 [Neocallimastix californiae]